MNVKFVVPLATSACLTLAMLSVGNAPDGPATVDAAEFPEPGVVGASL